MGKQKISGTSYMPRYFDGWSWTWEYDWIDHFLSFCIFSVFLFWIHYLLESNELRLARGRDARCTWPVTLVTPPRVCLSPILTQHHGSCDLAQSCFSLWHGHPPMNIHQLIHHWSTQDQGYGQAHKTNTLLRQYGLKMPEETALNTKEGQIKAILAALDH